MSQTSDTTTFTNLQRSCHCIQSIQITLLKSKLEENSKKEKKIAGM